MKRVNNQRGDTLGMVIVLAFLTFIVIGVLGMTWGAIKANNNKKEFMTECVKNQPVKQCADAAEKILEFK